MTELISKEDPRYFSQTSDEPYDRHHYRIVCQNKSFVENLGMRFKNIGGTIVIHLGLKEQLFTLLINQNQNQRVLNEFISCRKNHRFSVDYLCVFCYTTCICLLRCNNSYYCRYHLHSFLCSK